MAVSIAGTVASKLLEQVMEATKIAISCNKCCKVLHALLKELQPILDHAVHEISQSNFDNAFKRPRSAVYDWLDELEGTLNRAAVEVDKCIKQQSHLNPWSKYNTGKRILDVTESVKKLLQQAGLVVLAVMFSESSRAQKMEKMIQEQREMIDDLRASALLIEFATVAQDSLQRKYTTSSAQEITSDIKSGLHNLLQNLSLGPSDNMSRVDTGASSSSSCPRELIVNEDAHKLTDIQQVPQPVFGLHNFTMRLQQSITSSSIDAEPRYVGAWGMGGAGKTLLAQIAYNSSEVRKHFKGGKLIWLTVSQTPNIKELYDSFQRQLGLKPKSFAQEEEYKTWLYNKFLSTRVFLVLDDVWNEKVLEQLDLAKGRGSVTLVTTRNQPVLKKAGVIDEDEVQVGVLSNEDSWKLFCVHAFRTEFSNIPSQLQGVAELVADECKGLPLALKVIGGSMVGKTTRQDWEFQLNCLRESRELPEQQEEEALFGRLKLSYGNLDKHKECFLGFAAFPEDCTVEMEELVKLWKAQGLLDDPTKKLGDDPTLSAYYVVGLLIGRSLIEVVQYGYSYARKVHDVMRDLALHIVEGQRPITCLYRPGKELVEFPGYWIRTYEKQPCEVRTLSLMENNLTMLNGVTFFAPKLEVLLLSDSRKLKAMPKEFLKGIENLKVLDLSKLLQAKICA
jgi:disease resistance protein RPS2